MADEISFNFTKFTSDNPNITLQGGAEISNGVLALTKKASPGRGLYTPPVSIWDSTTGNVASFVTSFAFEVQDVPNHHPGDGIVFFLAPSNTTIPKNSSGAYLGIVDSKSALNPVVGVEFDSFVNDWDPPYAHIGIDVNTVTSLKTVKWNRVSGSTVKVDISYDSPTKILSVVATDAVGHKSNVEHVVDLKAVLPDKVRIGFSATADVGKETHHIVSWSFTSTWKTA